MDDLTQSIWDDMHPDQLRSEPQQAQRAQPDPDRLEAIGTFVFDPTLEVRSSDVYEVSA